MTPPEPARDVRPLDGPQRPPAELRFADELAMLRESDRGDRPPGWALSMQAARRFVIGDERAGITRKFVGNPSLIDRSLVTLATNRGLMLVGEPGTAKSLLSELLAAAVSGCSTDTIQGGAATTEDQIKYSWNYALLVADGPSPRSLVPAPLLRGMAQGRIVRFEEITGCPLEVQDCLLSPLSDRVVAIPELTGPDGMVFARDGFNISGGLGAASCSCGAPGTCRHVVALVLAYQRASAPATELWSPGEFGDDALAEFAGARALASARRLRRAGYAARVRRSTTDDPVPRVDLPTRTVRFLAPHQLDYAHSDAAGRSHQEVVTLAVWAFRVADGLHRAADDVWVQVGGAPAATGESGLEAAVALADEVLLAGIANLGTGVSPRLTAVRRELDAAGLRWPLLAVEELGEQLAAYQERRAGHQARRVAELLAELHARHRAATWSGSALRVHVLGTEEPAETPLRRSRLTGLGCRVHATGAGRTSDVFLADADTATVLVLRRNWPAGQAADGGPLTGHDLASRRIGGAGLAALAAGNVVTGSAVRSASRLVRLAPGRVGRTTVTASSGEWDRLPVSLVVRDPAALARELDELPPGPIRPRVEAASVRVGRAASGRRHRARARPAGRRDRVHSGLACRGGAPRRGAPSPDVPTAAARGCPAPDIRRPHPGRRRPGPVGSSDGP